MLRLFIKNIFYFSTVFFAINNFVLANGVYSSFCSTTGKITEQFCGDKAPSDQWLFLGNNCYGLERNESCDQTLNLLAPGCAELSVLFKLAKIDNEMFDLSMIQLVKARACNGVYSAGQAIYYSNGRLAGVAGGIGWYYPNGKTATTFSFDSNMGRFYYPNGILATDDGVTVGGRWQYPQQTDITDNAGKKNAIYFRMYSGMAYSQSPSFEDVNRRIKLNLFLDYILSLNGISLN